MRKLLFLLLFVFFMISCQETNKKNEQKPNKIEYKKPISVEKKGDKLKVNFDDGSYELFCPDSNGSNIYHPCPLA